MEGMLIREQDPEDLINNKEEWNQPGDVRIEFNQYGIKEGKNERLGGEELERKTRELLARRKETEKVDKIETHWPSLVYFRLARFNHSGKWNGIHPLNRLKGEPSNLSWRLASTLFKKIMRA